MNAGKTIGRLKALKKAILADGKVDWNETEQLLEVVRPLAKRHGFVFQDYERLLEKCRADGQITGEESKKLAEDGFRGIKFHPEYQLFRLNEPKMDEVWDAMAATGLVAYAPCRQRTRLRPSVSLLAA